jgi:hypothetical protein
MLYKQMGAAFGSDRLAKDLSWQWGHSRGGTLETCGYVIGLSLLLAVLALLWMRRAWFSWPRAIAWAAFVFAFGLPGFFSLRLAADWGKSVKCPNCARPRPTATDECPACGKDWPTPSATGVEIFDAAQPEALEPVSA